MIQKWSMPLNVHSAMLHVDYSHFLLHYCKISFRYCASIMGLRVGWLCWKMYVVCSAALLQKSTYSALQMPLLCLNCTYQESITGGAFTLAFCFCINYMHPFPQGLSSSACPFLLHLSLPPLSLDDQKPLCSHSAAILSAVQWKRG